MPDRTATPEELFDRWLDALNEPGRLAPPSASDAIGDVAAVAIAYRRQIGMAGSGFSTRTERNGTVSHAMNQTLPVASPNGSSWEVVAPTRDQHRFGWTSWLATAVVAGLLLAMIGGLFINQNGFPGRADDPAHIPGIAASPGATPEGTLSCASPGYVPVVRGEVDPSSLRNIGVVIPPVVQTDIGFEVPESIGPIGSIEGDVLPIGNGFLLQRPNDGTARAIRIRDGETWSFSALHTPNWLSQGTQIAIIQPYLVGPANEEGSDWKILDMRTGEATTTSEITGGDAGGYISPDSVASNIRDGVGIVTFSKIRFVDGGAGDPGPPAEFGQPFRVFLPGSTTNAVEIGTLRPIEAGFAASSDGRWFATNLSLYDGLTGEHASNLYEAIDQAGKVIGFHDDETPTVFVLNDATVYLVDPFEGKGEAIYSADETVTRVLFNPVTQSMVLYSGYQENETAIWLDPVTGDTREMPELVSLDLHGYAANDVTSLGDESILQVTESPVFAQRPDTTQQSTGAMYTLSMEEGSLTLAADDADIIRTSDSTYHYVARYHQGSLVSELAGDRFLVFDPITLQADEFGLPQGISLDNSLSPRYQLSPGGACVTLRMIDETGQQVGNTWVIPREADAEWVELDGQLVDWWHIGEAPNTIRTLPAPAFATPAASPAATPEGTLSCASPEYRPMIRGEADPDALAAIGGGEPIVRDGETTITAANGTEITFGADEQWGILPASSVILSGEEGQQPDTVTSLATGESWPVPEVQFGGTELSTGRSVIGPWVLIPTDESGTDWLVIDPATGQERLTSDIFGAPFDDAILPSPSGPLVSTTHRPMILQFSAIDQPPKGLVLPSSDLDDAYELGDEHIEAGWIGAITQDGSRIAYLHQADDSTAAVRILDGFNGELLAEYPAPAATDRSIPVQPVGLTADDSRFILRDGQHVWTVDLDTGELATVFDMQTTIESFAFDPTTGTALVSDGFRPDSVIVWIDPASGDVKPLPFAVPFQFPEPQVGWVLIQTQNGSNIDFSLLDMSTGQLATAPASLDRQDEGTSAWITGGGPNSAGIYVVQAETGLLLVLDGPRSQSFELSMPDGDSDSLAGVSIGISPSQSCIVYTRTSGPGEEHGTSWIAPLEPGAAWTELPFELLTWVEIPVAPQPVASMQPTGTPIVIDPTPVTPPGPDTATPDVATPSALDLVPDGVIPIVATDDPESIDTTRIATVGESGTEVLHGATLPIPGGDVLELTDAVRIRQVPFTTIVIVENFDTSRVSIDLTTGDILADDLPPTFEDEVITGNYLLTPRHADRTAWTITDLRTGDRTDTASIGDGRFDTGVFPIPMPHPADAPQNAVVQFAFATSMGDPMPWQGLAIDEGPPSGALIIPGDLDHARFLDTHASNVDPEHPTVVLSSGESPLVAYTTPRNDAAIVVEDARTGEGTVPWSDRTLLRRMHPIHLAGFAPDGESLVAWTGFGGYGPGHVYTLTWAGGSPREVAFELEGGVPEYVIPTATTALVQVRDEADDGSTVWSWKLLDFESGAWTDLPELDGFVLDRYLPGGSWVVLRSTNAPRATAIVIVDAATGEIAARLDDADVGMSTATSPSRDFGVLAITGHTGENETSGYVIDARSGESWPIEPPVAGDIFYQVSPDGSLLVATSATDTWFAPVDPEPSWTHLDDGRIVDWLWQSLSDS